MMGNGRSFEWEEFVVESSSSPDTSAGTTHTATHTSRLCVYMPARLSVDHPHVATAADGNALISQRIAEGEPFIAGRLGTNEICVLRANLTAVPRDLPR